MHSGEGEVVQFASDCICDGPVESWLQNVVDSMKLALMEEFRVVRARVPVGMCCTFGRSQQEAGAHSKTPPFLSPAWCVHGVCMSALSQVPLGVCSWVFVYVWA